MLAEWDGSEPMAAPGAWTIVDRNKYTDVTGPGGIYGSPDNDCARCGPSAGTRAPCC